MTRTTIRLALAAGVALLLGGVATSGSVAHAQEAAFDYPVSDGDTCANLAQRIWGHSSRYERIHALNPDLGPQPHRLRAGQTLRLPERARPILEGADAEVTAVQRRVDSRQPAGDRWNRARVGEDLFRGARVNTHERASAELRMRDRSVLQLREDTLVIIYGGNSRRVRDEGGRAVVQGGTLRARLGELAGLTIETPNANADLAGGNAVIGVDPEGTARVSNHGARASLRSREGNAAPLALPPGMGSKVIRGRPPTPPRPLPPTPRLTEDEPRRFLATVRFGGTLTGSWQPVEGAARYHIEIARQADGTELVASADLPARVTRFELHRVPPGRYHVTLSTIDGDSFESIPSAPAAFELSSVRLVAPGEDGDTERAYLGGAVEIEASPIRVPVGTALLVPGDLSCVVAGQDALTLASAGLATVTCSTAEGALPELTLNALAVELALDAAPLPRAGAAQDVRLTIAPAFDLPPARVRLVGAGGARISAAELDADGVRAQVAASGASDDVAYVELRAGDAVLARAPVEAVGPRSHSGAPSAPSPEVELRLPAAEALGLAYHAGAVGLRDERLAGSAMWLALGLSSAEEGEVDPQLRASMGLRAALLEDRLRIEVGAPVDALGGYPRAARRGSRDLVVGLGSLVLSEGAVGLAFDAQLWLPTHSQPDGLPDTRLVVSGDLSLRVAERVTLRTRQAGIFDLASVGSRLWASAYGLDIWLAGPVSLGAEVDLAIGEAEGGLLAAPAVGASLGLDFAPITLALAGRFGFGDDGERHFGTANVVASVRGTYDLWGSGR